MRVVTAGGHGKIALHLERRLAARGDQPVGLIRNPDHAEDLQGAGAEAVVIDLEQTDAAELAEHLSGADAVVFAAGAGPGSGVERKDIVDRGGAVLLADAAEQAGVRRYLLVSSFGAGSPPPEGTSEVFTAYLEAKTAAEDDLRGRNLDWTILRPGGLTDDPPTGRVTLAPSVERGEVPREDVATVLMAMLDLPESSGLVLELVGGDIPVAEAVAEAVANR